MSNGQGQPKDVPDQPFKIENSKNKNKVNKVKNIKSIYISRIYKDLKNKNYKVGKCNIFYIYEPKKRRIVSQNIYDKIINHLVSRYILNESLIPCLITENPASRKNKGTKYALDLHYKYNSILYNKYHTYYVLKCDIKNYFGSIDHFILKEKIELNQKTRIYKNINNFIYLGRNKYGKYSKYRKINKKIKYKKYLYENNKITINNYINSYICYKNINRKVSINNRYNIDNKNI